MTQTQFNLSPAGTSQKALILAHLQRHKGQWVPMPELSRVSGAYAVHSRISDLRGDGWDIEHRNEREPGRNAIKSFYRL